MSNAIAIRAHTVPGDEIICDKTAHIYKYEGGGYAALCGVSIALVEGINGIMSPDNVALAIRKSVIFKLIIRARERKNIIVNLTIPLKPLRNNAV